MPESRHVVSPYQVVKDLEDAIAVYTGAPYVVTVNSCTMALLLACAWQFRGLFGIARPVVSIPKHTYVSVPQAIIHAGGRVEFDNREWFGMYQLRPYAIWDSARWFTSNMYRPGNMQCVSFHATKTLGDTQGGAILLDNPAAYEWLKRARFDGRTEGVAPKDDCFTQIGWHCYMSPDVAARLLHRLMVLPADNKPLPNDGYPDLSKFEVFRR
jgi:dTDP-4-amino-4,6-dideoxygalactose transaminase